LTGSDTPILIIDNRVIADHLFTSRRENMKRIDEGFLEELEGKIDETFKETQAYEKEVKRDQVDTEADITDPGLDQDTGDNLVTQKEPETVTFDLTEEEVVGGKAKEDESGPPQLEGAQVSSRRYHPMEISTNTMVTKDNVEFSVRKFVKDLKECLRISKAVSLRFEIKTVNDDDHGDQSEGSQNTP
jgi:hypothetical protein